MNRAAFALVLAVCMGATPGVRAYGQDLTGLVKQAETEAKDGKHLDAYDTMRKATLSMWSAGPLLFRKALFVTDSPDGFGIYDPRPDSVFKQGEKLIIYVEPVGFEWEPKDGLNHARLVVDLVLKDGEGTVVGEQESFGTFTFDSREQNMEIMAALTIDFTEAPAGKYAAELKFNDKVGEKSASFELPFEIAE